MTPPDEEPLRFPKIQGLGESRNGHEPKPKSPTCSDCVFFSIDLQNIQRGFCHANPPTMLLNPREGQVMVMRPTVGVNNIACRHISLAPK